MTGVLSVETPCEFETSDWGTNSMPRRRLSPVPRTRRRCSPRLRSGARGHKVALLDVAWRHLTFDDTQLD